MQVQSGRQPELTAVSLKVAARWAISLQALAGDACESCDQRRLRAAYHSAPPTDPAHQPAPPHRSRGARRHPPVARATAVTVPQPYAEVPTLQRHRATTRPQQVDAQPFGNAYPL